MLTMTALFNYIARFIQGGTIERKYLIAIYFWLILLFWYGSQYERVDKNIQHKYLLWSLQMTVCWRLGGDWQHHCRDLQIFSHILPYPTNGFTAICILHQSILWCSIRFWLIVQPYFHTKKKTKSAKKDLYSKKCYFQCPPNFEHWRIYLRPLFSMV